jgi:thiamine biosynthesis lipoprotein
MNATERRRMRPLLGTFVEVGAHGAAADDAIDAAFVSLADAQARWSFHDPASELSRLNAAGGAPVEVGAATLRLLKLAIAMMRGSGHAFDITLGGSLVEHGVLPDHGGIAALPRGTSDDIELGPGWARLRRPVRLCLDGIAKGFAVDQGIRALRLAGARAGWINAGGDLRVYGNAALPLHRREASGVMRPFGALREAAVATSRVGPADPDFPAHVMGRPGTSPEPGLWTVLARQAWRADALTKVAANTPPTERAARVAALGGRLLDLHTSASSA